MFLFHRCCEPSLGTPAHSAWIIGASLGAVLISVALTLSFGESVYSQTLLYSAFPLALIGSQQLSRSVGQSRRARAGKLVATLAAVYVFFLAVTLFAESF